MWKTTDFPAARKGYTYSSILQVLLCELDSLPFLSLLYLLARLVLETGIIQLLLWRDKRQELRSRIDEPPPPIYSDEEEEAGARKPSHDIRASQDQWMNDEA